MLWAACFGAESLAVAPWLALAPLVLLLGCKRPLWATFVHGISMWAFSLYWVVGTLVVYGGLSFWLALLGLLLLAFVITVLCWLPFGYAGRHLWHRGGWPALLGLPALWVLLEVWREFALTGFPWNLAGYAVVDVPLARDFSALSGSYGVSFLVVLCSTAVALSLRTGRGSTTLKTLAVVALILVSARFLVPGPVADGEPQSVRVVQPNIPNLTEFDANLVARNYLKVFEMLREACDEAALIVLPESALWPYAYDREPNLRQDLAAISDLGCNVLINTTLDASETYLNSVLLIGMGSEPREVATQQTLGRYDKRHLVPFGEYVPLGKFLPFIDTLARAAGDFEAGDGVGLIPWGSDQLGVAICYEVIFPKPVAEQVRAGATVLVTVTNDAWYGDTSAPWQHLRAARFRAAENRRPLLRAAITGVSAVIRADGTVAQQLGVGKQGILSARVAGNGTLTPYSKAPWLTPVLCILILLACARFRAP